jgi:hypothetical protein
VCCFLVGRRLVIPPGGASKSELFTTSWRVLLLCFRSLGGGGGREVLGERIESLSKGGGGVAKAGGVTVVPSGSLGRSVTSI